MSEYPINITALNDFVFCPVSIYFHQIEQDTEKLTYQDSNQLDGAAKHQKCDNGEYSTKKDTLQGSPVYTQRYNLMGKIDVFDVEKGILTERKKKIQTVYDGYVFQLYAQYYALTEMGYVVKELRLYSMDDNTTYHILLPKDFPEMKKKFENTISMLNGFDLAHFVQENSLKCKHCIYEPICSYSRKGEAC